MPISHPWLIYMTALAAGLAVGGLVGSALVAGVTACLIACLAVFTRERPERS